MKTEQVLAEPRLHEREEHLRLVVEQMPSVCRELGSDPATLDKLCAALEGRSASHEETWRGRHLHSRIEPLRGADGAIVGTVIATVDATDAVRAEQERARLQVELARSRTLAALGALVGGVAHEVRNPLFGTSATLDAFVARSWAWPSCSGSSMSTEDTSRWPIGPGAERWWR